jgi:peptidoglycan-N-acetylmuramic acid deacetylase
LISALAVFVLLGGNGAPAGTALGETATPTLSVENTPTPQPTRDPRVQQLGGAARDGEVPSPTATPTPTATATPTATPTPQFPSRPNWSDALMHTDLRSGDPNSNVIYLTFDDGWGYAQEVLNTLNAYGVDATACFNGLYMQERPATIANWFESGMAMCNHTWAHLLLPTLPSWGDRMSREEELAYVDELYATYADPPDISEWDDERVAQTITEQVIATEDLYEQIVSDRDTLRPYLRTPYGAVDQRVRDVAAGLGFRSILWSVDPQDWRPGLDSYYVSQYVLDYAHPGAIVLLHTGRVSTLNALPRIIEELRARGYTLASFHDLPDWR